MNKLSFNTKHNDLIKSRSFAEWAEIVATAEPPPYALPVKLVATVQSRNEPTVQTLKTYTAVIRFFSIIFIVVVVTRVELSENVISATIVFMADRKNNVGELFVETNRFYEYRHQEIFPPSPRKYAH